MLQHFFVGKIGDASVDEDLKALNVASMNSANRCLNQTDHTYLQRTRRGPPVTDEDCCSYKLSNSGCGTNLPD